MARSDPQMNFRIPAELKEQLELAAKDNNRSATAELINRLDESLNAVSYALLSRVISRAFYAYL